jgi:hypothetical protein
MRWRPNAEPATCELIRWTWQRESWRRSSCQLPRTQAGAFRPGGLVRWVTRTRAIPGAPHTRTRTVGPSSAVTSPACGERGPTRRIRTRLLGARAGTRSIASTTTRSPLVKRPPPVCLSRSGGASPGEGQLLRRRRRGGAERRGPGWLPHRERLPQLHHRDHMPERIRQRRGQRRPDPDGPRCRQSVWSTGQLRAQVPCVHRPVPGR